MEARVLCRKIRGIAMHIFILSLLPSRASTGETKVWPLAFSMQFSVNMRQDMVPAEPEDGPYMEPLKNASQVV